MKLSKVWLESSPKDWYNLNKGTKNREGWFLKKIIKTLAKDDEVKVEYFGEPTFIY